MEYQKKKKQLLSTVEYSNLLSLSLVQNKLERNFKSIVQALLLTQTEGNQVKEDLHNITKTYNKQINQLNDRIGQLEKKMQAKGQMYDRGCERGASGGSRDGVRPSIKKFDLMEENKQNNFERKSSPHCSQLKVKINLVESVHDSEHNIPEPKNNQQDNANMNNQLWSQMFQGLKQRLDKIQGQQVDGEALDKKLASMKDSINLLKAQLKAMADREAKSARRVSLGAIDKLEPITQAGPNTQRSPQDNTQVLTVVGRIQDQLDREMNNFHIEINTMKLCIEEIKQAQGQLKRRDNKSHIQLDQLAKNQKKLQERVQNTNDIFEGSIKQIKLELLNLQTTNNNNAKGQEQTQMNAKKSRKNIEIKQNINISPNANNQINDKISKLQAMIQGLVTQAQFKRFKTQIKDKISGLESQNQNIRKQLKDQIQMLTQILDAKEQQIAVIQRDIQELKCRGNQMSSHCERKNNISISRCEELKKNLQNLREDLEFYKSMNQLNQSKPTTQGLNDQNGNGNNDDRKNKGQQSSGKSAQELKKYLNRKLHDQRTYLLGLIRELQKKIGGGKNNTEQDLANMWDKLAQINLFIHKKANQDDVKKSLAYYQKKLSNIYQRINSSDQNNEDARIAKTNWFCLSCDKNLHSYQGKVGQHVVWDSMPIKPGHAKFYNKEQKKSLPTLKRG